MKLSKCEKYIMSEILNAGEVTSFDILDKAKVAKKISENTVRTLLTRMIKKKAICISAKNGKTYTYKALINKDEFLKMEMEEFLEVHQMSKEELKSIL